MNGDHEIDDHDRGLAHDLPRLVTRRRAVGLLAGGLGSAFLAACGSSSGGSGAASTATPAATAAATEEAARAASAEQIPEETAGPFPGDGSNGPDALTESGVVRRDISKSFGGASGVAEGVPTTVELTLLDVAGSGKPLAGAAVYLWHCDMAGRYSLYDQAIPDENYLRGVQESDDHGRLTFETIFPAAYPGRWPHMHFEVYESLEAATTASTKLRTSQLAIPEAVCKDVYATQGYEQSLQTLAQTSLDSDMVFADGYRSQLAAASGSPGDGIVLKLNVGV
jgi:protocatechuate 3,4-dioxygenase beta subunit